jgi:hypothetical protein
MNCPKIHHHFSRSHALRGNAGMDALRPALNLQQICRTRSVQTGIPTQSVGTRKSVFSVLDGVCNPVRNVLELKRYGRGCKPCPAASVFYRLFREWSGADFPKLSHL